MLKSKLKQNNYPPIVQCMTSSNRMLSVTNTMYMTMYTRPNSLPSFQRKMVMLVIITNSIPTSSRTEQKRPLLKTEIGCPLCVALKSSQGMGRLYEEMSIIILNMPV